ncbi:hypothetical protein TKK_0007173 [Trichogramma kaykai]
MVAKCESGVWDLEIFLATVVPMDTCRQRGHRDNFEDDYDGGQHREQGPSTADNTGLGHRDAGSEDTGTTSRTTTTAANIGNKDHRQRRRRRNTGGSRIIGGGGDQRGFLAPAAVMESVDLRALGVRALARVLKDQPAKEHVWKENVHWGTIAQEIDADGHDKEISKGVNRLLRRNDTETLVAQGISLEEARHLIACFAFAHPVPRGRVSSFPATPPPQPSPAHLTATPTALLQPPTAPPPYIFCNEPQVTEAAARARVGVVQVVPRIISNVKLAKDEQMILGKKK